MDKSAISKPDKFANQCEISTWFAQFDLFLRLSKVPDTSKLDLLLNYMDLTVFESMSSALDLATLTYDDAKKFLFARYSSFDPYIERIAFFNAKFSGTAEEFAANLNSYMDKYSCKPESFKEEILVAKFISAAPEDVAKELRVRRPTTLNECVQIATSLHALSSSACLSVKQHSFKPHNAKPATKNSDASSVTCFCCGKKGHFAKHASCPAKSVTCSECGKSGHFAKVCRTKSASGVKTVIRDTIISNIRAKTDNRLNVTFTLNGQDNIKFNVDTGAEVSIMSRSDYIKCKKLPALQFTQQNFKNFDGSKIAISGVIPGVTITYNNKSTKCDLFVADVASSVVGMDVISGLRLKIDFSNACRNISLVKNAASEKVLQITLKSDAPNTLIQPLRRLPFALEQPVEDEIQRLIAADVIEPINSSPYVSPIVVVRKKDNSIRLCVDYRRINNIIVVDQFPIPSVDEILSRIGSACFFSKIDLKSAYHQIYIDDASRDLTAFITHVGLFRYKRVPFGIANAPAGFNRIVQRLLSNCSNILIYFDDILVFGRTKKEHDSALKSLKDALSTNSLEINEQKSVYCVEEIEFLGRRLCKNGVAVPNHAAAAIANCSPPTSVKDVRRFLGMSGYFRSFIPNFNTIAAPLIKLLQDGVTFQFGSSEHLAFTQLKEKLLSSSFLAYFDTSTDVHTILTTDASGVGLGAMLSQKQDGVEKPVYFISRQLKANEKKFSSSEMETLAVIWAVERFHQYLCGRHFEIRTDHSALREVLTGKNKHNCAPARITRWATRLLPYSFDVTYIRGSSNLVSDCLSRLPIHSSEPHSDIEVNIAAICGESLPCFTFSDITDATASDEVLQKVLSFVENDWPSFASLDDSTKPYYRFRTELCYNNGILLRGDKIVVPLTCQHRLLTFAHEGHFGMSKTKSRLRNSYWWPGMDKDVETLVQACHCCKMIPRDSPVQVTQWETRPWHHLSIDIAGPKHDKNGRVFYLIAVIDQHSKYVMCKAVKTVTSNEVMAFLTNCFNIFGLCSKLTTDNGPQFTSLAFREFLTHKGIVHIRSSIYNPQANGGIERMNRNFKKLIQNSLIEQSSFVQIQNKLDSYILNYNTTKHSTTDVPPCELLFRYLPRTMLDVPLLPDKPIPEDIAKMGECVKTKLEKRAAYANDRRRPNFNSQFKVGDLVCKPPGQPQRIAKQVGPYTYRLENGYTVNARRLQRL